MKLLPMGLKRRKNFLISALVMLTLLSYSLQVNCISQSLIALRLLPRMIETAQKYNTTPRIVVVTSEAHSWCPFNMDLLNKGNLFQYFGSEGYCTPA